MAYRDLVKMAFDYAVERTDDKERPVGCFLLTEGTSFFGTNILKKGYTEVNSDKSNVQHAEISAVKQAKQGFGHREFVAVVTKFPCLHCGRELRSSGVKKIVSPAPNTESSWYENQQESLKELLEEGVEVETVDFSEYDELRKYR